MPLLSPDRRETLAALLAGAAAAPAHAASPRAKAGRAREVLAFYYRGRHNPQVSGFWKRWQGPTGKEAPDEDPVPDTPILGPYDSHDPSVLAQHARWLKAAGCTGMVLGAWSREIWEDKDGGRRTQDAMHAQGLKTTVYLEGQKGGVEGAKADLGYLYDRAFAHPSQLRHGGRPVVFAYRRAFRELPVAGWREAARAVAGPGRPEILLIGDVDLWDPAYADKAKGLDGTHSWSVVETVAGKTPAEMDAHFAGTSPEWRAKAAGALRCATVMPGWNDVRILKRPYPRPTTDRFGTGTLQAFWRAALRHDPDFVLINSFNAWHNGCEIEPSREWGDTALKANAAFARRFLARA